MSNNQKGFTLIELLVFIAILGVLVAIGFSIYNAVKPYNEIENISQLDDYKGDKVAIKLALIKYVSDYQTSHQIPYQIGNHTYYRAERVDYCVYSCENSPKIFAAIRKTNFIQIPRNYCIKGWLKDEPNRYFIIVDSCEEMNK